MTWPTSTAITAGQSAGVSTTFNALRADVAAINGWAIKGTDESVASNAILQDDDELSIAIPAAGTYAIDFLGCALSVANAAGDIRIGGTWPAGTCHIFGSGPDPSLASGSVQTGEWKASLTATSGSSVISYGTSTTGVTIQMRFLLIASTAGTFQLQWAQVTPSASATTLKAGSHLRRIQANV